MCKCSVWFMWEKGADCGGFRYTGFVHFLDSYRSPLFSYLTSAGMRALDDHKGELEAQKAGNKAKGKQIVQLEADSDSEDVGSDREGG